MGEINIDTTDVTRYIHVVDSAGAAVTGATVTNFDLQYTRAGAAPSSKADATDLGSTNAAHSDNGMYEIDATNSPGLYRVDWPDAAFVNGVGEVILSVVNPTDGAVESIEEVVLIDNSGLVDDVWDEVLTGATHNVSTSAGRRLRALAGGGVYENGSIWIDTINGTAGTEDFENGTSSLPVDSLADAKTLATSLGIFRFTIVNGSSITLDADLSGYSFFGDNWTLALGGQTLDSIHVEGAAVTGIMAGTGTTQTFKNCHVGATSIIAGTHFLTCGIEGTITVVEAGDYFFDNCHSGIAGTSTWVFDFGGAIGNTNLNMRNYSGGVQLENMGDAGTDTASIEGRGQVIEGTCTGGTVAIRGCFTTSGITNLTLSDNARYDIDQVADNSGRILNGTATGSSTTSLVYVQAGDPPSGGGDDDYNGALLLVWRGTDKTTARLNVRTVDDYDDSNPSFSVSPALEFTPQANDLVEIWSAAAAASLAGLTGGFGVSSPNRLIDHLRSIMSKGAVTPASLGTYDPAADSLEYASERRALMEGSGFATGTDSLEEIRDAIDTLVAPSVVSSSALSGSGFLSDCVSLIRKAVDEPSVTPKYTDGDVVEYLQAGIDQVITDIHVNTDHPIMVRHSITLVDGTQDYIMPPQVGELLRVAKMDSSTGLPEYEVWPGSFHNPGHHGWKIEGNILRLLRDWDSTDTLELLYIPNAEPLLHKGTAEAVTSTVITLMATPTDGTLGTRPNEYVGMIVRILSSDQNYKEERVITAYDLSNREATINKAWDTTPTGTVVYEIVPTFGRMFKHVVSLRTAIDILSQEGNSQRMATLERNYLQKMSAIRRQVSKKEGRFPHHFDGDTWDNVNRGGFYGA
jgi:hypothetical protein